LILRMPSHIEILSLWLDVPATGKPIINLMYEEYGNIRIKDIDPGVLTRPGGDGESPGANSRI